MNRVTLLKVLVRGEVPVMAGLPGSKDIRLLGVATDAPGMEGQWSRSYRGDQHFKERAASW